MKFERKETQQDVSAGVDGVSLLPSVGDRVFSADGAELGVVDAVVKGGLAQGPAIIVIAKGIFLDAHRCVAIDHVHSVQAGVVTLHLKARQVEHLPPCMAIS